MNQLGHYIRCMLLAVHGVLAVAFVFTAYASYLHPQSFPLLSCAGLAFPFLLVANLLILLFWSLFYWRYALLQGLVLLLCAAPIGRFLPLNLWHAAPPQNAVKVLTFNTEMFANAQPHTRKHPNPVLDYLMKSDADIICLQECSLWGKLTQEQINEALKKYKYRHTEKSLACFSRYPILSSTLIEYPSQGNHSMAHRLRIGKDTVLLINNHLESNRLVASDKEAYKQMVKHPKQGDFKGGGVKILQKLTSAAVTRSQQAEKVAQVIGDFKGQGVIVCGDFNDTPFSYAYRTIRGSLKDAYVDSGSGLGFSYHRSGMFYRIDHLLVSPHFQTYRCTVDRSVSASDHYPVWCYLSWD